MNARDDLARIIMSPESFDGGPVSCGPNPVYAARTADAILAAGYRGPRQVSTVEELDALPVDSIIFDSDPDALLKVKGGWLSIRDYDGMPYSSTSVTLPATVLHEGATE